jgi:3-oxoacyl-[acyl-carrier-protein] synthase-3
MRGRFELGDYRAFLINLRQQVKDGALWMSRAASNIGEEHLELRSTLMQHAVAEHRDFRLLEADYVATGGALAAIRSAPKNIGSEALSAWMFHEASRPNPFGLLGAMFIIEGLGSIKAAEWGRLIQSRVNLPADAVRFLLYHGENDVEHMKEFEDMLRLVLPDVDTAARIVTCARVTGRLYALQIEEIVA